VACEVARLQRLTCHRTRKENSPMSPIVLITIPSIGGEPPSLIGFAS
jgi:hypothetical protein